MQNRSERLRHDDFVVEAASCDGQEQAAKDAEGEAVLPKMSDAGAAKNDSARDVDVIRCGNQVAERVQKSRDGFAWEDVAREKDAGQNGEKSELHCFGLGRGFAGNENAERERGKEIRQRKKRQQKEVAVNGHEKNEAHERQDQAKFKKADEQVRKQFAE